jgi:hypothetical protein
MKATTIGIDLAKNVIQVHGFDERGDTIVRKQLKRDQVLQFFGILTACPIGMEAYGSAHYWARKLEKLGHVVKLMAPHFVKPYVKSNKNDMAECGGDLQSRKPTEYALCCGKEWRATVSAGTPPRAAGVRQGANGTGESDSWALERVRDRHPTGTAVSGGGGIATLQSEICCISYDRATEATASIKIKLVVPISRQRQF